MPDTEWISNSCTRQPKEPKHWTVLVDSYCPLPKLEEDLENLREKFASDLRRPTDMNLKATI